MKKHYIIITPFFPTKECFVGPFIYDQVKAIAKESKYEVSVIKIIPLIVYCIGLSFFNSLYSACPSASCFNLGGIGGLCVRYAGVTPYISYQLVSFRS